MVMETRTRSFAMCAGQWMERQGASVDSSNSTAGRGWSSVLWSVQHSQSVCCCFDCSASLLILKLQAFTYQASYQLAVGRCVCCEANLYFSYRHRLQHILASTTPERTMYSSHTLQRTCRRTNRHAPALSLPSASVQILWW